MDKDMYLDQERMDNFFDEFNDLLEKYGFHNPEETKTILVLEQYSEKEKAFTHYFCSNNNSHYETLMTFGRAYNTFVEMYQPEIKREAAFITVKERIKSGKGMYVECVNDKNKPDNFLGDWIKQGWQYKVVDIYFDTNSNNFCFVLEGMSTLKPFSGYSSIRFVEVQKFSMN